MFQMGKFSLLVGAILAASVAHAGDLAKSLSPKEEKKIQSLVKAMTLEEKCGMLHGNSVFYVSGVPRLGIPEWALSDGPHGVRAEINRHDWNYAGWTNDYSTCFPTGTALAATWNPSLSWERGIVLGDEARARGKDVLLGPGVNIIRTPLCGRNFEYMSEDPLLNAKMCVPYIQALQSRDVAASVKHYVANNQETNRGIVDVYMSERALRELYLPAFKAAVEEGGALTVMCAYNKFRGKWCSENPYLGVDILRKEFGFTGVYMTDWGAAHSTVDAAKAGLDLEMGSSIFDNSGWFFGEPLIKAVKSGAVSEQLINEKVANVLRVMFKTKVFDAKNRNKGSINTPEHQQAAYNCAKEAIVLLQNNGNLLPLDFEHLKSVAVIGDNALRKQSFGGQSSEIKSFYEVTPFEAIQRKFGEKVKVSFAQGYNLQPFKHDEVAKGINTYSKVDSALLDEAVAKAKNSDVAIIFCGLNHDFDTESQDKPDMKLPYGQERLIQEVSRVNPKTIVVLVAGSPVEMASVRASAPAILWSWFNGMEAGNAVVDVISGKVNPSGKMPFTLPVSLGQSPAHALGNFPGRNLKVSYDEGILVGYRWFDTKNITPEYPFGYGLSYTQFAITNVKSDRSSYGVKDTVSVTFSIANTGKVAGAEVAQLYMAQENPSVMRPAKELKGFQKVFVNAGESKQVTIKVPVSSLAFFSEKDGSWLLEKGTYQLMLGTSSRDIKANVAIQVSEGGLLGK